MKRKPLTVSALPNTNDSIQSSNQNLLSVIKLFLFVGQFLFQFLMGTNWSTYHN